VFEMQQQYTTVCEMIDVSVCVCVPVVQLTDSELSSDDADAHRTS